MCTPRLNLTLLGKHQHFRVGFYSCVTAVNGADLYNVETSCSSGAVFDGTPPVFGGSLTDEAGNAFRRASSNLCTSITFGVSDSGEAIDSKPVFDPTSGVLELELQLLEQVGNTIFPVGDSLSIVATTQTFPATFCRDAPIEHGRRYFSRLLMRNGAVPSLVSSARSIGRRRPDISARRRRPGGRPCARPLPTS